MRPVALVILIATILIGCEQAPPPAEKAAACLKNLEALWVPLEFYMTDHEGQYPAALDDLAKTVSPTTGKPYIDKIPDCPPGWSYVYEVKPGAVSHYTVICRSLVVSPGLVPDFPRMTSSSRPISQP